MNRLTILLIAGVAAVALGGCTSLLQSPPSPYVDPPKAQTYEPVVKKRPVAARPVTAKPVTTAPVTRTRPRESGGGSGGGNSGGGGGGPGGGGWGG